MDDKRKDYPYKCFSCENFEGDRCLNINTAWYDMPMTVEDSQEFSCYWWGYSVRDN